MAAGSAKHRTSSSLRYFHTEGILRINLLHNCLPSAHQRQAERVQGYSLPRQPVLHAGYAFRVSASV